MPDITFMLDIPAERGTGARGAAQRRRRPTVSKVRNSCMHERMRRAFLDIAEEEPERCVVIDASQPEAMVAEDVWEACSSA